MIELETLEAFDAYVRVRGDLTGVVLQRLDLTGRTAALLSCRLSGAIFLGCQLAPEALKALHGADALVFPILPDVPFKTYRARLYTAEELYDGYDPSEPESYVDTLDARIYEHWEFNGRGADGSVLDTLCRRLHDHAITTALRALLHHRKTVAIVGGHDVGRDTVDYRAVAELTWTLTRRGYFCISGGGPGAMEAANLGAYFANRTGEDLAAAVELMRQAPRHDHPRWLSTAFEVRARYPLTDPETCASAGVPTWLNAHEPPNLFATHIAKYFSNSVREDGLGTVARRGVVFAPGSADTIQEIFRDASQNHFSRAEDAWIPMIFLGEANWTWKRPVFPMLTQLAAGRPYAQGIFVSDDPRACLEIIERFDPDVA